MNELANAIQEKVRTFFPALGPNKYQEIVRLVFEIAKREGRTGEDVLSPFLTDPLPRFAELKAELIKQRFPRAQAQGGLVAVRCPRLDLDPQLAAVRETGEPFLPRTFVIENSVRDTRTVRHVAERFPGIPIRYVDDHRQGRQSPFQVKDYNERRDTVYLIEQRSDFFLPCPCSAGSSGCGYWTFNLGYGCSYDCQYCFLQSYINAPGIMIPANLDDFFEAYDRLGKDLRLGTGQFTDSLVLDHLTGYAPRLVEFFRERPHSCFEFKTKSDQVEGLLAVPAAENIIVSWSLNPQQIVDQVEWGTASLDRRLIAAARCQAAGYGVAFHFDPVIVLDDWQGQYENLVERLFDKVAPQRVAWISVGALRMTYDLKTVIENRFPYNDILDEELMEGYDGKLRYSRSQRREIYQLLTRLIKGVAPQTRVYLCMEEAGLTDECGLKASCF